MATRRWLVALIVALMGSLPMAGGWGQPSAQRAGATAAAHQLPAGSAQALQYLQQQKLTASDGVQSDAFGNRVAFSADGTTALVGAHYKNNNTGMVYMFTWSGSNWNQQGVLTASDGTPNDFFGNFLTLSADGSTALVSANPKNGYTGPVYVFARNGSTWSQQAELTGTIAGENFGTGVAVSADGGTALVGADGRSPGAAYVFTRSGSIWSLQSKLTAADAAPADSFGDSVGLSSDGGTALVGAHGKNANAGAAYVFIRNGVTWGQQAELTAADRTQGDRFGETSTLSADGRTALVGAQDKNGNTGAAYVFTSSAGAWSQQAKLTATDAAANDAFGWAPALSADGSIALVGADGKNTNTGAAYVFARSGSIWSQQAKLTAADAAPGDHFGSAVVLSADGSLALVGADGKNSVTGAAYIFSTGTPFPTPTETPTPPVCGGSQKELTAAGGAQNDQFGRAAALAADGSTALVGAVGTHNDTGAAYVFAKSLCVWSEQAALTAADGAQGDRFSDSAALSADGSTILLGADGKSNAAGAAYVFARSGAGWVQQAELTAAGGVRGDQFGTSVALSADGNTALVGAIFANSGTAYSGAAYVFSRSGGSWVQRAVLAPTDAATASRFGSSAALSADGGTALVGANGNNAYTGAAYVFTGGGGSWVQQAELTAADGAQNDQFGSEAALSSDGGTALLSAQFKNSSTGAAYVFARSGAGWVQQAELTAADGAQGDLFGIAVALVADGATALLGAREKGNGIGAAYLFARTGSSWSQQRELASPYGTVQNDFGDSAALSAGGRTELIGAPAKNSSTGAAYVFDTGAPGATATNTPTATATATATASPTTTATSTSTPSATSTSTPSATETASTARLRWL